MATGQAEFVEREGRLYGAHRLLPRFTGAAASAASWSPGLLADFLSLADPESALTVAGFAIEHGPPILCGLHGLPLGHGPRVMGADSIVRHFCPPARDRRGEHVSVDAVRRAARALSRLHDLASKAVPAGDAFGLTVVDAPPRGTAALRLIEHDDRVRLAWAEVWEWIGREPLLRGWGVTQAQTEVAALLTELMAITGVRVVAHWGVDGRPWFDTDCPDVMGKVSVSMTYDGQLRLCQSCRRLFVPGRGRPGSFCTRFPECRRARKTDDKRRERASDE